LKPGNETSLFLFIDNDSKEILKDNNWYIARDIWYSFKSEINIFMKDKPDFLKLEFEKSIFYKDSVDLKLCFENKIGIDSSLYYFKNDNDKETIYDSIILKFVHYSHNFDFKFY